MEEDGGWQMEICLGLMYYVRFIQCLGCDFAEFCIVNQYKKMKRLFTILTLAFLTANAFSQSSLTIKKQNKTFGNSNIYCGIIKYNTYIF